MASTNDSATAAAFRNSPSPPPRNRRPNPIDLIRSGGLGHAQPTMSSPSPIPSNAPAEDALPITAALNKFETQYLPHHPKSLAGIALRSFSLGLTLCFSSTLTLYFLQPTSYSPLWRAPFFLALLSTFHFLEFWTTAAFNTRSASISSFLLTSNGYAYAGAHTFAFAELLLTGYSYPDREWLPSYLSLPLVYLGLVLVVGGQIIRSWAMYTAGQSFNHIVQVSRQPTHALVTTGIYGWLRHPSYFGFFWWAIGTQLVLGNGLGLGMYVVLLWMFFSSRIEGEEIWLVKFFGEDYKKYRAKTGVGIPFIR